MPAPRDFYSGDPIPGDHFHDTLCKIWYQIYHAFSGSGISVTTVEGSALPYGADAQAIAYYGTTNNIQTIVYSKSGSTVKTRTFTYVGGGAANDDLLSGTVDS